MPRLLSVLLLVVLSTGCASTTVIRSDPSGARVKSRAGELLGRTPYEYSDSATANHRESFVLELEGYSPEYITIRKDQWDGARTAGGIIGGLIFFPVFATLFWAADYKDGYTVELRPLPERDEAPARAAPHVSERAARR